MRVGHLNVTRSPWYDRTTFITGISNANVNLAPHATTTRSTYTVPSGVRSFIDALCVSVGHSTLSTTSGVASQEMQAQISGGTNKPVLKVQQETTAYFPASIALAGVGQLQAGDKLVSITADASTNGTNNYAGDCKLNEYAI